MFTIINQKYSFQFQNRVFLGLVRHAVEGSTPQNGHDDRTNPRFGV